jgi:phosphoribosyl 1,2-cyclic phosphate phosphodiesterase
MANLDGQLVFLGTGTSVGVPAIGCHCQVCSSPDPRNRRFRSSVALGLPGGNLLIDTSPDLRSQLLREQIDLIHAVLYTHEHADHVMGLDDVRLFPFALGHAMPLYCDATTEQRIRRSFDYAFDPAPRSTHAGATPQLQIHRIDHEPFELLGSRVVPIPLRHGGFEVLGFRFGKVAYCTDTNGIPESSWPRLEGLDLLILDALRIKPHATHFSLDEALAVIDRVRPRRALLTHISHDLDHATINEQLPSHVQLAYDGQRVLLS